MYGGFGKAKPWIPVYNRYKEINAETDINSEKSIYNYYKQLMGLRKSSDAFINGKYENITDNRQGVYIYKRTSDNEEYIVICNFERQNEINLDINGEIVLSNTNRNSVNGIYSPYECVVLRNTKNAINM